MSKTQTLPQDVYIYRLAAPEAMAQASLSGAFAGEALDDRDGYIHCSRREQLEDTLSLHFDGVERLALAKIRVASVNDRLKWEKSRGGALFPHLYGPLPFSAIESVRLIRRNDEGDWVLPSDLEQGL
ncbi:DUF952 domain-containing protein [Woodsholea maritima]|uniref:DUF952 domain-containing protein n=1 Tax=Woodsholea maritima TaxID=240237 RepID=UPI000475BABA|nr:DUF952 domain-containing protein [Woodsholea maritima]